MHVEPELEALLRRLAPACEEQWVGATPDEIDELEFRADVQLPPFYRWFLERMGRSMGPIANPRRDLSVDAVLAVYRRYLVPTQPDLLLIGIRPDDIVPMHFFYDLSTPARNDALVRSFDPRGGFISNQFETLREMIGWSAFIRFRMNKFAWRCRGTLRTEHEHVLVRLEPAMVELGFTKPLPSGRFLGIYERTDVALECSLTPDAADANYTFFEIGADDEATLRSVLGTLDLVTGLQFEVSKWTSRPL